VVTLRGRVMRFRLKGQVRWRRRLDIGSEGR
jgi:hypothetical protein